ncbi:MAG: protein jag [Lachnospiraceae bacterium]|nr:protein jag [Lachnospiraceae bacterium]
MEYVEFSGKSLESVISDASKQFSVDASEIEYEIVDMGKSGILGFNAKPTIIKARVKEGYLEKKAKDIEETSVKEEKPAEAKKEEPAAKEEKSPAVASVVNVNVEEIRENANKFLSDLFKAMDLEVKSEISYDFTDNALNIELSGPEMGILIGKRGQTLDSVQYLTSLIVNKGTAEYIRVKVDTEDYRDRRKKTLENLAKNLAFKVKRTKRPVSLEPMNPYERRIIHSALQGDRYVVTHSEGDEPFRRVVITLKK